MMDIEKRQIFNRSDAGAGTFFKSILNEAHDRGLLNSSDLEKLQMQSAGFLALRCEAYNGGNSSSIRVEAAEHIMESIIFTIGLYLKTLTDDEALIDSLRTKSLSELYHMGRKVINAKLCAARHIYKLIRKNRLATPNYSYNTTTDAGTDSFFSSYDPDFSAHDCPSDIDYPLCNDINALEGIELILAYLENLYLENEFCRYFDAEDIHRLLYGYDKDYKELLVNIFKHVLTAAIGLVMTDRCADKLEMTVDDVNSLCRRLSGYDDDTVESKIREASEKLIEELGIKSASLIKYIKGSIPKITRDIICSVRNNTLDKTITIPAEDNREQIIRFQSGAKMSDEDYRVLLDELLTCRHSPDKLALINERVSSFDDLEDILKDAGLDEEEACLVFSLLGDVEIAALIKRHPHNEGDTLDLPEAEQLLRAYLDRYVSRLPGDRQDQISDKLERLCDE